MGDTTGVNLIELYDCDSTTAGTRLVYISTRGFVGTGGDIMIPGYVVSNESSRRVLVRALGPTLGTLGVSGSLADPQLRIVRLESNGATTEIAVNDNWGSVTNPAATASTAAAVGAFALAYASKDAAIVVTLDPGVYTVHATGVGGDTGTGLVEIYEVP